MLTATQITRTIVLVAAVAGVAAPSASARVADAHLIAPPASESATSSLGRTIAEPGMAGIVAHREAIATKAWQTANQSTGTPITEADDSGFDPRSAGIGAGVLLILVLTGAVAKSALHRHRVTNARHRLA
jgi:hypothetical protein